VGIRVIPCRPAAGRSGVIVADPGLHPDDELPISPVVLRWLAEYARAAEGERDRVVGLMLRDLNARLVAAREEPRKPDR
jgi:hypothetical protein